MTSNPDLEVVGNTMHSSALPEVAAQPIRPFATHMWKNEVALERHEHLAVEEPLEIRGNGRSLAVTMRTPGNDFELVSGFLWTERIVAPPNEPYAMVHCETDEIEALRNVVDVRASLPPELESEIVVRHFFANSGCGVCGKSGLEALRQVASPVAKGLVIAPSFVLSLPQQLRRAQKVFAQTGGLHAAALFSSDGKLVGLREDIGRHNAVDKVLGYCRIRDQMDLGDKILCVSGRAGFEIVQKAWIAQIPVVVAISAASSLAVETAQTAQITLVGFTREDRFTVYTHPERIIGISPPK